MKKLDKRSIGVLLIVAAAMILTFVLISVKNRNKGEDTVDEKKERINMEVPPAERKTIPISKVEAYGGRKSVSRTQEYYDECDDVYHPESTPLPERLTHDDLMEKTYTGPEPEYVNPYRETPEQREARHRRQQEQTIKMAQELTGASMEEPAETEEAEETVEPADIPEPERIVIRPERVTSLESSLGMDDGISTLDGPDSTFLKDDMKPFRCMFAKHSRIRNGQRVSVILLEEIIVGGVNVPKHTHLMATCTLSGRLEMSIANIEIGGRILPLGYEAYDIDGSRGIYCPDVGDTGKRARSSGRNIIGSRLSGRMGGLARDIVNTGVSLMQSKDGEQTVNVPAGYEFYIIKKKKY